MRGLGAALAGVAGVVLLAGCGDGAIHSADVAPIEVSTDRAFAESAAARKGARPAEPAPDTDDGQAGGFWLRHPLPP